MVVPTATPTAEPVTRKVAVIVNPVSCPNGIEQFESAVRQEFERHQIDWSAVHTSESVNASTLAKRAVDSGVAMVVAAGGDGTVMEAMNALIGTDVPLGVIPLGTGNLLAVNLAIPLDLAGAVDTALSGTPKRIDVVRVNDGEKYFAIMGGLGFDARIMAKTDRASKQRFGRCAYLWTAIKERRSQRFQVSVSLDGGAPIHLKAKSVLIGNLAQIAPNVRLFDNTAPDDGLIEVGLLKANSVEDFVRLGWRTLIGRPADDPQFDAYQARRVEIVARRPEPIEYDGDSAGMARRLSLTVASKAVAVMVPKSAD
ncbi:MAG TPA: diacylglycerol kinase family protein [Capsulimonadaceae bacterium]|jgi:YegS/Rv2252/BmrU family lipid kinase